MPNLWTEDDFTLIENETTRRRAMVWPSGYIEECGSTGERDITADLVSGTVASGRLLIRRIRNTVALRFDNLVLASGDGTTNITIRNASSTGPILAFRPGYFEWKSLKVSPGGHAVRINVSPQMTIQVQFGLAGATMHGTLMWLTEAGWPSSLPGVADGEPI